MDPSLVYNITNIDYVDFLHAIQCPETQYNIAKQAEYIQQQIPLIFFFLSTYKPTRTTMKKQKSQ